MNSKIKKKKKVKKLKKKFQKEVLHYPPILVFIPNITFFKVKQSLADITIRKVKLKLQ
jgi:late competence protein required for DNA uptake (superfamily II DNA/RNA helicase)